MAFEGLSIIYIVIPWVILFSVNNKSVHQQKQKPIIWSDIFRWKFRIFRITVLAANIIHPWITFCFLLMNKSLCSVNLSLELHVSTFWLESNTLGTFFYISPSHKLNSRDQPWRCTYPWCRTDVCSWKLSEKINVMLGNTFVVPFFVN